MSPARENAALSGHCSWISNVIDHNQVVGTIASYSSSRFKPFKQWLVLNVNHSMQHGCLVISNKQ